LWDRQQVLLASTIRRIELKALPLNQEKEENQPISQRMAEQAENGNTSTTSCSFSSMLSSSL
jgi:hypothetical protein